VALRKDEFHYESEEQKQPVDRTQSVQQQVVINISPELYNRIEFGAQQHNQSLSDYVEDVLEQALPDEEDSVLEARPVTPEMFEKIMAAREQIFRSTEGQQFEDTTELIRQMREERSEELDRYLKGV